MEINQHRCAGAEPCNGTEVECCGERHEGNGDQSVEWLMESEVSRRVLAMTIGSPTMQTLIPGKGIGCKPMPGGKDCIGGYKQGNRGCAPYKRCRQEM